MEVSLYLGLGSNLGQRHRHIQAAVRMLDEALCTPCAALSSLVETKAWGFRGKKFLNACALYRLPAEGTPEEQGRHLLTVCKRIERDLGRRGKVEWDASGRRKYHNRTIDIDILFLGTERIALPELTVPHPLIPRRPFVLDPLREILEPGMVPFLSEIIEADKRRGR